MILRGPQVRFELTILSRLDLDDWRGVRVAVDTPEGRWTAIDPCVTDGEVCRLIGWLNAVADCTAEPRLTFLEPDLAFAVAGDRLEVELRWGLRPAWASGDPEEPFVVTVPAEPAELRRAAEALRRDVAS